MKKLFERLKVKIGNKFTNYTHKFPSRYASIYWVYSSLKLEFYNIKAMSSFLYGVFMALLSYTFFEWDIKDIIGYVPIVIYLLGIIVVKFLGYLIRYRFQNTGVLNKFQFSGTRLIRKVIDEGFDLNGEGIDSTLYEFVTEETIDIAADLNARAYAGGVWGKSVENKKKRNLSHIRKNSYSIMLFKFKHNGPFVGFTHIFPVTDKIWHKYTSSKKIKDNDYEANWIVCENPETKDEFPFGLILFSVGCPEIDIDVYTPQKEKEYAYYLGEVIEKAQVYHINELLKKHFTNDERYRLKVVPALLQNEDLHYINFYKGYSDMSNKSGDNNTIIEFQIRNHHAV